MCDWTWFYCLQNQHRPTINTVALSVCLSVCTATQSVNRLISKFYVRRAMNCRGTQQTVKNLKRVLRL